MERPTPRLTMNANSYEIYRSEAAEYPLVTPEEERRLAVRVQAGDSDARKVLVNANLRIVLALVQDYKQFAVPIEELVAEGNLGLIEAATRYDGRVSFWHFAKVIVHRYIQKAMAAQGWAVRVPGEVHYQMLQLRRESHRIEEKTGNEPDDEALAESLGIAAHRVSSLRGIMSTVASIGTSEDDDDGAGLQLSDGTYESSGMDEARSDRLYNVRKLLAGLEQREQLVLGARYGLKSGEPMRLEAIGERLGVSRQRVEQIIQVAEQTIRDLVLAAKSEVPL